MQSFIDKTAEYLLSKFPEGLGNVCIVFPNRRAGLFLKESLSAKLSQPIWLPSMMSVEDFVFYLSDYNAIDPVRIKFDLYKIYLDLEKENPQPFYEFLSWADILLKDFNDADMAMADVDKLFTYLSEAKALSLWNADGTPLTEFQLKYLKFYSSIASYYHRLREYLILKKQVYHGLAYRILAENLMLDKVEIPWDSVVFVGFNALSKAEGQILKKFIDLGIAEMLWDVDAYYVADLNQEAGHYIRESLRNLRSEEVKWQGDYFSNIPKEIEIIGVPQNVAQVKLAGQLLKDLLQKGSDPGKTAIILNDESLLIPLLHSLPPETQEFNVTMGFPLKSTTIFGLISHLFSLHENALKFNIHNDTEPRYFYADLISLTEHPLFAEYTKAIVGEGAVSSLSTWINDNNKTFVTYAEISEFFSKDAKEKDVLVLSDIFKFWGNDFQQAIHATNVLLTELKEWFALKQKAVKGITANLELEYIFHFLQVLNNLREMTSSNNYIADLKTFRLVYFSMIQSVSIPFYGEPLKGFQIMGMLESRTLDFENLIMLSVNDDFIPSGKPSNSFIPFEVKLHFYLPSFRERNAVFAYHFYRLMQRAKRVFLLYNTEPGGLSGGDKSRFLMQLQNELTIKSPNSLITESLLEVSPVEVKVEPIIISKSKEVMERLNQLAEKGLSASAMNSYRRCSLQFYYRYIAGITEIEEIEESIEDSTLGSVVHDVLEKLYSPYKGRILTKENILDMFTLVEGKVTSALTRHYARIDKLTGKNLLIVRVANLLVNNFLRKEIQLIEKLKPGISELSIIDLEKKLSTRFELLTGSGKTTINLVGYFDRIDKFDNTIRIIDYKSGKVEARDLKFANWDDLLHESKLDKCFQLLYYLYLFNGQTPGQGGHTEVIIFSLRNLSAGPLKVNSPENESSSEMLKKMETILRQLFSKLFDQKTDFVQTDKIEDCQYCSFKSVCNR